jgi:hypothetical protein
MFFLAKPNCFSNDQLPELHENFILTIMAMIESVAGFQLTNLLSHAASP